MKNTYKLLTIIAIVAMIALSMTACALEDEGSDGIPKSLVISGIPTTYAGKVVVGIADVSKKGKANLKAYSEVNVSTTVNIPLISAIKDGEPYTGTGSSFIILIFNMNTPNDDTDDVNFAYSGGTTQSIKFNIQDPISNFTFNQFIQISND
ncbi:hypothetical protein [Treponema sp. R80B11-R83G3]